jgi:hypothetical protein
MLSPNSLDILIGLCMEFASFDAYSLHNTISASNSASLQSNTLVA